MNSFKLTAVGNLARNPELSTTKDVTLARFCLVGQDRVSESERDGRREVVTSLWFIAFADIATAIAHGARKGDQLILEARIVPSHWTDQQGEKQSGHTFIVTGFRFGSRGGEHGSPIACVCNPPDNPAIDAALAASEETN